MNVNDVIHGFTVTRVRPAAEYDGTLYEMEHAGSGAKLCWLKRNESNKTFCVSFRTVPEDDTGVFHILEHSVLNGSRRYPAKEPFVELLKSSLQTFLNALTFPDKTCYPVSSRNEADFENLTRVYLDAVFFPRIYSSPEIFDQEGWHYEPAPGGGYVRSGVVLSEMKGAFSSPDELMYCEAGRLLYPDTCYGFVSGGRPDSIPSLTWEKFTETHRRFYHPSNALIFLDGDMPIEKILGIIDGEYLAKFERKDLDFTIARQSPLPHRESEIPCPAPGGVEEQNGIIAQGWLLCDYSEREKLMAAKVLSDYLTDGNDAPLTRAVLDAGVGQDVEIALNSDTAQPNLHVVVRGTDAEHKEEIAEITRRVLLDAAKGVDRGRVDALLDNLEFHLREQSAGWATPGVDIALSALEVWNYGGDPMDGLNGLETLRRVRGLAKEGYFERLCGELAGRRGGDALVTLRPDKDFEKKAARAEAEAVSREVGGFSEERLAEVNRRYEVLRRAQAEPDSPEAIASIPRLSLADVGDPEPEVPTEIDNRVILHDIPARGITYARLFFPAGGLDQRGLQVATLLCSLLGDLPTANYTAQELRRAVNGGLGSFSASVMINQDKADDELCRVRVRVAASCLDAKRPGMLELLREILLTTDFSDRERVRTLVLQQAEDLRLGIVEEGNGAALAGAMSGVSASGVAVELTGGVSYYRFIKSLADSFDECFPALRDGLFAARDALFAASLPVVSLSGKADRAFAEKLAGAFPGEDPGDTATRLSHAAVSFGIVTPASVAFAGASAKIPGRYTGLYAVLSKLLTLQYFWQEVRVKGGAYGTGLRVSRDGIMTFYTYRDPKPANSLDTLRRAGDFLREYLSTAPDLDGIILGTLAGLEPYRTPPEKADFADTLRFAGYSYSDLLRFRTEALSATPEKLLSLCESVPTPDKVGYCVVGERGAVEGCGLGTVDYI